MSERCFSAAEAVRVGRPRLPPLSALGTGETKNSLKSNGLALEAAGVTASRVQGTDDDSDWRRKMTSVDASETLTLEHIRENLIRQEDSIIFGLIERAQYKMNRPAYDKSIISIPGFDGSLVEYLLHETEHLHAKVRRYTSPAEHPFFPENLPKPMIGPLEYPKVLSPAADAININPLIWEKYYQDVLPEIVEEGDDGNYGSTACADLVCLQALSKRIHYGKFVAEAKYRASPEKYDPLIKAQDGDAIMRLLTFEAVEAKVTRRVEVKATVLGQELTLEDDAESGVMKFKVDPEVVARLYTKWVMPLTKTVQVEYLLRRHNDR